MKSHNHRGQAIVELAIFGGIILILFGVLLSFMQRFNDQQYVQMEAFRRALEKGCTYSGETSGGAGASVQYTLLEDRRNIELSGGFRKGNSSTLSASSNVFWAVPKSGAQSENLIAYRINGEERTRNYRDFVPIERDADWSFRTEEMATSSDLDFNETLAKEETPQAITNTRRSRLSETKTIRIPYTIRKKDSDEDDDNDEVIKEGAFWENYAGADANGTLTQRLYRDSDGQYKYSSQIPQGAAIERSRTWITAR